MHSYRTLLLAALCTSLLEARAGLVLSEIMFDPAGEEATDEFIELYNDGNLPVQLTGWSISDGEGVDTLVSAGQGLTVAPRQYVLVLDPDYIDEGSTTYDDLVPESALIVTIGSGTIGSRGLSNSQSETISLFNGTGNLIDEYAYTVGNASGHSDEKIRHNAGNDSSNWANSEAMHGTPGFRNSVTPAERDLAVVSFNVLPEYPEEGALFQVEFEIGNTGLQPLASELLLQIDTSGTGQFGVSRTYTTGSIAPGELSVVRDSLNMSETGIMVLTLFTMIGDDDTTNNRMSVIVSSVATAVGLKINEIQYNPLVGHAEWVELAVAGPTSVSTRGMTLAEGSGVADSSERIPLPELIVSPGEFVVVSDDSTVFLEDMPIEARVIVLQSDMGLNNNGDSVAILNRSGEVIERVDYRPSWGDETGVSLERVSLDAPSNDVVNWGLSVDAHMSTPGRVNSRSVLRQSESSSLSVLPSPFTPNGDGIDEVTVIRFSTGSLSSGQVLIRVFDVRGRLVRDFDLPGDEGVTLWDGRNSAGEMMPTSRYIVLLEAESSSGGAIQERTTVILARPK